MHVYAHRETETISLEEHAYSRLRAEQCEDESFIDAVKRITAEVSADWRRGFGRYASGESGTNTFVETMRAVRKEHAAEFAEGTDETFEALRFELDEEEKHPLETRMTTRRGS